MRSVDKEGPRVVTSGLYVLENCCHYDSPVPGLNDSGSNSPSWKKPENAEAAIAHRTTLSGLSDVARAC